MNFSPPRQVNTDQSKGASKSYKIGFKPVQESHCHSRKDRPAAKRVAFNHARDSHGIQGAQGNLKSTFCIGHTGRGDLRSPSPFPGFLRLSPSFCEGRKLHPLKLALNQGKPTDCLYFPPRLNENGIHQETGGRGRKEKKIHYTHFLLCKVNRSSKLLAYFRTQLPAKYQIFSYAEQ